MTPPEGATLPAISETDAAVARVATRAALTPREVEIVRLLVDGYRVRTIARTVHLSTGTIRNHLSAIFHKVGVHGQAELVEHIRRSDPA